jgi:hypothetical protein
MLACILDLKILVVSQLGTMLGSCQVRELVDYQGPPELLLTMDSRTVQERMVAGKNSACEVP